MPSSCICSFYADLTKFRNFIPRDDCFYFYTLYSMQCNLHFLWLSNMKIRFKNIAFLLLFDFFLVDLF